MSVNWRLNFDKDFHSTRRKTHWFEKNLQNEEDSLIQAELPLKQAVRLHRPKRHPSGKKKLLPLATMHYLSGSRLTISWMKLNLEQSQFFSPDYYHDFIDKKAGDVRLSTASAERPSFTDTQAPEFSTFELVSVDDVIKAV